MRANVTSLVSDVDTTASETLQAVVSRNVGEILGGNGISKARLARAIGLSGPGLTMKLSGQRPIDLEDLEAIAAALNVEASTLLVRRSPRPVGPAGATGGAWLPQMDSNHQPSVYRDGEEPAPISLAAVRAQRDAASADLEVSAR